MVLAVSERLGNFEKWRLGAKLDRSVGTLGSVSVDTIQTSTVFMPGWSHGAANLKSWTP
jgi:hypothetical protein